jgi:hypothetical protein
MVNNIQEAEVSSSSTLWATGICRVVNPFSGNIEAHFLIASKEWVIPAKPKPGRKPKKDTSTRSSDDTEVFLSIIMVIFLSFLTLFYYYLAARGSKGPSYSEQVSHSLCYIGVFLFIPPFV